MEVLISLVDCKNPFLIKTTSASGTWLDLRTRRLEVS